MAIILCVSVFGLVGCKEEKEKQAPATPQKMGKNIMGDGSIPDRKPGQNLGGL